jgi:hypothetical protein
MSRTCHEVAKQPTCQEPDGGMAVVL